MQSFLLNKRIQKLYPWLTVSSKEGQILKQRYPTILSKTKQTFSHQFGTFVLMQTDMIMVFAFSSLHTVTLFSNYVLITQKITGLIGQVLNSSTAGVGNLIASGQKENIKKVFFELLALRYWIAGTIIFCLYQLTPSFVRLWLGEKYILDQPVFIVLLINTFIMLTRPTVDSFIFGYGLFKDVWAPWIEAVLNLALSIALGYNFGLLGIMTGTMISMFLIIVFWKPYFLYKEGFKDNLSVYWKSVTLKIALLLASAFTTNKIITAINLQSNEWVSWLLHGVLCCLFFGITYGIALLLSTSGTKSLFTRIVDNFHFKFTKA